MRFLFSTVPYKTFCLQHSKEGRNSHNMWYYNTNQRITSVIA